VEDLLIWVLSMSDWLLYALLVNVFGFSAYAARRVRGRLAAGQADWFSAGLEAASRELGLRLAPRHHRSRTAAGGCGAFAVRIWVGLVYVPGLDEEGIEERVEELCVSVTGGAIPRQVSFTRERDRGDDVLIGDSAFDDIVEVRGEPTLALAMLDHALRNQIRSLVAAGGRIENGELLWKARPVYASREVPQAVRGALDLARVFSSGGKATPQQCLARNAGEDPVSGVRLWNLLTLQERFAQTREAREASLAALRDQSPWVRVSAARFLRDEGRAVLEELATDTAAPDQAAAEAVALLAARGRADEIGELLVSVLKNRSGEARRQAILGLGRLKHSPALGPLVVLLERADARTAAVAAEALGGLGDARAEPALLQAAAGEARELRIAAARALGPAGTVAAVEPLMRLLETRRLDAESRQAIRECVAAIQSRLAGAEAGQLSIAEDARETGRLSLAAPAPGQGDLSFAPEQNR
jgi:HEAT repeat protein